MMSVLVTGAGGFVGRAVVDALQRTPGYRVCGASQSLEPTRTMPRNLSPASLGSGWAEQPHEPRFIKAPALCSSADWTSCLEGIDTLVHCAARAHRLHDRAHDALATYREINTEGTLTLARQAAQKGVRRFIFLSSIGVHGDRQSRAFTERDTPAPHSPYAVSKWEAEQGLQSVAQETGMDIVILRLPLVYGPGAPGNFGRLVRWVARGIPLPLARIQNQRSLLGLDNLVHAIEWCCRVPQVARQTLLLCDGQDVSTPELVRELAHAMGRAPRLFPCPVALLRLGAAALGRSSVYQQLAGNLQVDASKARALGWVAPQSFQDGIWRAVNPSA